MKPLSVVIAQNNVNAADSLARSLNNHFRVVKTASTMDELLHSIPKNRADVAIVDLELADLEQVRRLTQQFAGTTVVCTHRLADEKMWTDALAAGAADCCHTSDVRAIVLAASNLKTMAHAHAA